MRFQLLTLLVVFLSPSNFLLAAELVSDNQLGFRFHLPEGFSRDLAKVRGNTVHAFHKPGTGKEYGTYILIERLNGTIDQQKTDPQEAKSADSAITHSTEKWKSFDIEVSRVSKVIDRRRTVRFNAQVPLAGEAIQVSVVGDQSREAELKQVLQQLLADLEGHSNWSNVAERSEQMLYVFLGVGIIVVVYFLAKGRSTKEARRRVSTEASKLSTGSIFGQQSSLQIGLDVAHVKRMDYSEPSSTPLPNGHLSFGEAKRPTTLERFLNNFTTTSDVGNSSAPVFLSHSFNDDFRNCIELLGGKTFNHGIYRVYRWDEIEKWTAMVSDLFTPTRGQILVFAADWAGRQFAVDSEAMTVRGPSVRFFDVTTPNSYCTHLPILDFHNSMLVDQAEAALGKILWDEWHDREKIDFGSHMCVGNKTPLFLGGQDVLENLELCDMEYYLYNYTRLYHQTQTLPEGKVIDSVGARPG